MTRFNSTATKAAKPLGFMQSIGMIFTYEGGTGYVQDAKSELYRLSATNMGSDTFYESGDSRDSRAVQLIREVGPADPQWMADFIPFLRGYERNDQIVGMSMRRSAIIAAVEYGLSLTGIDRRNLVPYQYPSNVLARTLQRADEPGEVLAYYTSKYGRSIPSWMKYGLERAIQRLYTEYSVLKYNSDNTAFSMQDVLRLTHPRPTSEMQSALFRWITKPETGTDALPMILMRQELNEVPVDRRASYLLENPQQFKEAGATWEWVGSWLNGAWTAEAWETIIPTMGFMALTRNLRNFEKANISQEMIQYVVGRLTDPSQVRKSRLFPYRFLSAYRQVEGTEYDHALDIALNLSLWNIPKLSGKTLILQDTSGSMSSSISSKSKITCQDAGAVFGGALALAGNYVDWVMYADHWETLKPKKSLLKTIELVHQHNGNVGHGTQTFQALQANFKGHDRVIIITDGQAFPYGYYYPYDNDNDSVRQLLQYIGVPVYTFDLGGYKPTQIEDSRGYYTLGGLTDTTFSQIPILESGKNGVWPWMIDE